MQDTRTLSVPSTLLPALIVFQTCLLLSVADLRAQEPIYEKAFSVEHLSIHLPTDNWKLTSDRSEGKDGKLRIMEFLPDGKTIENAEEMIILEAYIGLLITKPDEALELIAEMGPSKENCEAFGRGKMVSGTQNNYPIAATIQFCGKFRPNQKGVITAFKGLGGKEGFYVVRRALRVAPFDASNVPLDADKRKELGAWITNAIYLCSDGDPSSPCPAKK